jgi:hypothetical protein
MGNDITADRSALLKAATLVRPALASLSFVPALTHIMFDGEWATAYDDRMAIAVCCSAGIRRLIPGVLLVQALTAFGGKEVLFHQDSGDSFVMKSGRSKVTLPTLPLASFPFDWPDSTDTPWIDLDIEMVQAVKRCLISVNKDASQPAQMGVTFDTTQDGHAVFFSTDNGSVSRCECKSKVRLPGDAPVIMPLAFCEQLVALTEAFMECPPAMMIGPSWLEVQFISSSAGGPEARLFTRMPVDLDPMDFPKVIRRHCGDLSTLNKRTCVVPESFDDALARALLVLGRETHKKVSARVVDRTLKMHATSDMGDVDDSLQIELEDVGPVTMEAGFVVRGLKHAERIGITDTVTILVGGERSEFVHMVAHVRDSK